MGYVSLVMNLRMLLRQTPAGDLLDKMPYKRAVTAGAPLEYSVNATPTVTSVSPRRGSTAGGTALTLSVANLPSGLVASNLTATIAGIAATVTSVAYSGGGARGGDGRHNIYAYTRWSLSFSPGGLRPPGPPLP